MPSWLFELIIQQHSADILGLGMWGISGERDTHLLNTYFVPSTYNRLFHCHSPLLPPPPAPSSPLLPHRAASLPYSTLIFTFSVSYKHVGFSAGEKLHG